MATAAVGDAPWPGPVESNPRKGAKARMSGARPFTAASRYYQVEASRLAELRKRRPSLRREEGEWRPLLLETPPGPGPVGSSPSNA